MQPAAGKDRNQRREPIGPGSEVARRQHHGVRRIRVNLPYAPVQPCRPVSLCTIWHVVADAVTVGVPVAEARANVVRTLFKYLVAQVSLARVAILRCLVLPDRWHGEPTRRIARDGVIDARIDASIRYVNAQVRVNGGEGDAPRKTVGMDKLIDEVGESVAT